MPEATNLPLMPLLERVCADASVGRLLALRGEEGLVDVAAASGLRGPIAAALAGACAPGEGGVPLLVVTATGREADDVTAVLAGLGILYSRITHSRGRVWASRVLWGWILAGWGIFNVVEGILDHHVLGIHHVISGPYQTIADIAFLVFGALLILGGWALQRSGRPVELATTADPRAR